MTGSLASSLCAAGRGAAAGVSCASRAAGRCWPVPGEPLATVLVRARAVSRLEHRCRTGGPASPSRRTVQAAQGRSFPSSPLVLRRGSRRRASRRDGRSTCSAHRAGNRSHVTSSLQSCSTSRAVKLLRAARPASAGRRAVPPRVLVAAAGRPVPLPSSSPGPPPSSSSAPSSECERPGRVRSPSCSGRPGEHGFWSCQSMQ